MTSEEIKQAKELSKKISSFGKGKTTQDLASYYKAMMPSLSAAEDRNSKTTDLLNSILQKLSEHDDLLAGKVNADGKEIAKHLKDLKGNDRLDIGNIRNGENLAAAAQKSINMNDMRWHGSGGASINYANGQTPTGLINSSNKTYTLANLPSPTASLMLFYQGQLQLPGGVDYTLSGQTITMITAPISGTALVAFYQY